jgi:CheY-like chemotaxis protein
VGDQLRFKQIIVNLLGNAVKFTSSGGITVSVQAQEQSADAVLIRISISDTGVGVSAEAREKIFQPFVQEDGSTTRMFGGTGLGLSISLRLAELMGGSITVESTPGVGSCFELAIPFGVARTAVPDVPADGHQPFMNDGPSLRILFVEDTPTNISFGMALLKKLGHDAVLAENGKECLTALEKGAFDLVLMDIQMPVMNGEEALRQIRQKEQGGSVRQPVIALTAFSLRGEKERFLADGFDGYVSKPLLVEALIEEIKRVMDARH